MDDRTGDRARRVVVVTWNLRGRELDDASAVTDRLAALGADVACLQEIQRAQAATIRGVGPLAHGHWWFKHWPIVARCEGMAVLSRWPVTEAPGAVALTDRWWWWRYTRRIAAGVTVAVPGADPLTVWTTHLSSGPAATERLAEVDKLLGLVAGERTLVCGDLNARPDSDELARLAVAGWRDAWDIAHPGEPQPRTNLSAERRRATQRLDYLLVSPDLEVVDATVPSLGEARPALSDHLPVAATLTLSTVSSRP